WDVKIGYRQSGASGKFQTAIAASNSPAFGNFGGVVDAYSAGIGAGVTDLGTATLTNAGTWKFRFTVTGSNPSSTGYHITIDYIRITPLACTNTPPTISNVADQSINENTAAGPYSFTIGDAESPAGSLTVQAVSLNTNLLPAVNIVLGGANSSRNVTLTPATNQYGSAGVLLLVGDGTNQTPATFTLNVKPVNTPPATAATNLTVITNTYVDLDLSSLVSDVETPAAGIFFAATNPAGGLVSLLGDGHTARFSATNHLGAASYNYIATDQGPDPRWLLYYNFETPDQTTDKRVTDSSIYGMTGAIEDYGTGSSAYDTSVPAALAASSTQSLALTAAGDGNGARLATWLPASTYNLANADWTLATWFRHTTIPNTTNVDFIFYMGVGDAFGGTGDELCLYINSSSQIQLQHFNTINVQDVNLTGATIPAGVWHHVAVVFARTNSNAGQLGLYLDGVRVGSLAPVNWQLDQTDPLVFGGVTFDRQSRWFTGNLDDLVLYGAALSASDLARLAGGTPVAQLGGLSATNTVTLAVQPLPQPQLSGVQYGNSRFQMTVTAYAGSGYTVQSSTNLIAWVTAFVTNAVPSGVFVFTDPAATNAPAKFYRVRSGP
ncbi:MAG TPA: LamG-like jellyroll fold domain-containing protein, partial [Candidatus Acidoferrales bacterium]|nr:LamG-like jellyroll fold domain-containing protein [Candidatus Acidoferrales bacterium]